MTKNPERESSAHREMVVLSRSGSFLDTRKSISVYHWEVEEAEEREHEKCNQPLTRFIYGHI